MTIAHVLLQHGSRFRIAPQIHQRGTQPAPIRHVLRIPRLGSADQIHDLLIVRLLFGERRTAASGRRRCPGQEPDGAPSRPFRPARREPDNSRRLTHSPHPGCRDRPSEPVPRRPRPAHTAADTEVRSRPGARGAARAKRPRHSGGVDRPRKRTGRWQCRPLRSPVRPARRRQRDPTGGRSPASRSDARLVGNGTAFAAARRCHLEALGPNSAPLQQAAPPKRTSLL